MFGPFPNLRSRRESPKPYQETSLSRHFHLRSLFLDIRDTLPLMAPKRKSESTPMYSMASDTNGIESKLSITKGFALLPPSKQSNISASSSKDATVDDTNNSDFAQSNTRDLEPLRGSKRSKTSDLIPPEPVLLTEHPSNHKASERHHLERLRLLELPVDILCLVVDPLDIADRACLKYAHPALGLWSKQPVGDLSACAKTRIVNLLTKDGAPIPRELVGWSNKNSGEKACEKCPHDYPYCVICRCNGHLSHCPVCRVRTCAREGTYFSNLVFPD